MSAKRWTGLAALFACVSPGTIAVRAQTPANVLIVVNASSALSRSVGDYYALRRHVPLVNICRIHASEAEQISRDDYNRDCRGRRSVFEEERPHRTRSVYRDDRRCSAARHRAGRGSAAGNGLRRFRACALVQRLAWTSTCFIRPATKSLLRKHGEVRASALSDLSGDALGRIRFRRHQRIDRPRASSQRTRVNSCSI